MKDLLRRRELINILLIFLFTLPVSLPLFRRGFFLTDDGEWMIVRLTAFFEALRNGQIPVRFLLRLNHEYGYPLTDFAYPAFLYIGSMIHVLGFGFIDSIKVIIFLSLFLSAFFTYQFLRKKFDSIACLVGSFAYLYTPYHLFDLYKRGSIGELLSICVIPFIFWQIESKNRIFISLGVFLLVLSHNIIAAICLPIIFLYGVVSNKREFKAQVSEVIIPFVLGGLLSAFFFIPAVYDLRYIVFQSLTISHWNQFFADTKLVGISTFVILGIGFFLALRKLREKTLIYFIIVSLFSIFMATFVSSLVWKVIPSSFILYPYRFLSILPIGIAFISAYSISKFKEIQKIFISLLFISLFIYSSFPFAFAQKYLETDDNYYLNNFATTTAADEYMPRFLKQKPIAIPKNRVEVIKGAGTINLEFLNSKKINFVTTLSEDSTIRANVAYFPGWVAFADGRQIPIDYKKEGLLEIKVPRGEHQIKFSFGETAQRLLADIISVAAGFLLLAQFVRRRKA